MLEDRKQDPVLPLVRQLREVLDAQDQALTFDPSRARSDAQRGEDLEIRAEDHGQICIAPQACEEATPEFTGDPVCGRKVVSPFIASSSVNIAVSAARFLYRTTLGRDTAELLAKVPRLKRETKRAHAYSVEEVEAILKAAGRPRDIAFLRTVYGCGLRVMERRLCAPAAASIAP
ncbi:MAG: hypothetical protein WCC08_05535, partial [Terrimicrobiaceae bacterium]